MRLPTLKNTITAAIAAVCLTLPLSALADEIKRVMVFGDSNSWGWAPVESILPTTRYGVDVRWPSVMATQLGAGYEVINESLSARTAATDDNSLGLGGAGLNGLEYLPAAIASNMPLDLVVIMLGTNDTKAYLNKSPLDISLDVLRLASEVQKNTGVATSYKPAKVLIISPPALGTIANVDWLKAVFTEASVQKSKDLAGVLGPLATAAGLPFFDAGSVAKVEGVDGVHMLPEGHLALAAAVADQVRNILK
jgi:lysophospholipase L1-like esterase